MSTTLVSYVARELDLVFRAAEPYASLSTSISSSSNSKTSTNSSRWSLFSSSNPPTFSELDLLDPILQTAMKNAFIKMDDEIVKGPIKLLERLEKEGKVKVSFDMKFAK